MKPQLLIGAATSGSGKTTFTMGLLRALHKRGLRVQPFKCGPDYIDTQFHTLAADHESVNLDIWMASNTHVQHLYNKYGDGADVCVTEGVMGLFDGYQRSKVICTSPELIAAYHVLHRLREPRHPPCALLYFPYSFAHTCVSAG